MRRRPDTAGTQCLGTIADDVVRPALLLPQRSPSPEQTTRAIAQAAQTVTARHAVTG